MNSLSFILSFNNHILYFLSRSPPVFVMLLYLSLISGGYFMDYLKRYKKMISLRGLTDHTMKSYQTYISAYLDYIENTLHKTPSQVSYKDQRRFLEWYFFIENCTKKDLNTYKTVHFIIPFLSEKCSKINGFKLVFSLISRHCLKLRYHYKQ